MEADRLRSVVAWPIPQGSSIDKSASRLAGEMYRTHILELPGARDLLVGEKEGELKLWKEGPSCLEGDVERFRDSVGSLSASPI